MSGSVSKWAVCPIQADADLTELDSHLGVEDAAFQDFQKEGYKKWTGFEAAIPGETCVDPAEILPGVKGFEGSKACEINELHADHVEKYTRGESYEKEDFVCPLRPPLPADEQLTILMEKKDTCFLRMTGKQEQHYEWHYQGHFPARRQNDRKANNPRTEFELIKLMKVSEGGVDGDVSLGRFCSLDELQDNPRFCNLATVHNLHMSVGEFADNLAKSLTAAGEALRDGGPIAAGTVVAPLGVGATAVSDSVAKYQAEKKALFDSEKEGKEIAKDVAVAVSEKTWDNLRGAGRLLHSTAKHAVSKVMPSPPGTSRIITELDERYFANNKTGDVLFSLSFQKSIGSRWFSVRNAKERFTRYVVSHPCPGFDPAFHFSMRRRWSEVVLRMVRSAWLVHNKSPRPNAILEAPSLHLALRGEALRFETQREHTTDEFYRPFASMLRKTSVDSNASAFKCTLTKDEQRCDPDNMCELVKDAGGKIGDLFGFGNLGYRYCKPKVWARAVSGSWWHISDAELRAVVAPAFTTGQGLALSKLRGLEMDLYCATKGELRAGGAPQLPADAPSLESCLTRGIEKNAVMKAREPWKLYFPDEVVVVARFKELTQRFCKPSEHSTLAAESKAGACGNGAVAMEQLDQHVKVSGRLVEDLRESGRTYMGLHTGAGWPSSTLEEVVLQPQDVLETLGLISKSNGR